MDHPRPYHQAAFSSRPQSPVEGRALLSHCAIELSTNDRKLVASAAGILPHDTHVYVPKLPGRAHADGLAKIRMLKELGFKPVPHIAARSVGSSRELEEFLRASVADCGTDRVLVVGGDDQTAAGPFGDSAAVIASGILGGSGIRHVDVAGYPDGHPRIPAGVLREDMARKVGLSWERSLSLTVVTQFSFVPERIADYCVELARSAPALPVHAGVVGPTSARRLLQFARICGVSTTLRAVEKLGLDSLRLLTQADPGRQVRDLARRKAAGQAGNLAGIHLFTFGGFAESAAWVRETISEVVTLAETNNEI